MCGGERGSDWCSASFYAARQSSYGDLARSGLCLSGQERRHREEIRGESKVKEDRYRRRRQDGERD